MPFFVILECKEYAQNVFQQVKVQALIYGEPVTIKKIDKCMHKSVPLIVGGESVKVMMTFMNHYVVLASIDCSIFDFWGKHSIRCQQVSV